MKALLKKLVRFLPADTQAALRRRHYRKVVQEFDPQSWEYYAVAYDVVTRGDTIVDVGANVGYIAATLAGITGPEGRVIAIEPIPVTFDALTDVVQHLGLNGVHPIQCALSAKEGQGTMSVPVYPEGGGRNYYESTLETDGSAGGDVESWSVPLQTLEQICADEKGPISFIKIDVEGHERSVIEGGRNTLRAHRPWLLIEVAGDPSAEDSNAAHLFYDLIALGYDPCVLEGGKVVDWTPGVTKVDYLFRPPSPDG